MYKHSPPSSWIIATLVPTLNLFYILVESLALFAHTRIVLEFLQVGIQHMEFQRHPASHGVKNLCGILYQLLVIFSPVVAQGALEQLSWSSSRLFSRFCSACQRTRLTQRYSLSEAQQEFRSRFWPQINWERTVGGTWKQLILGWGPSQAASSAPVWCAVAAWAHFWDQPVVPT